MSDTAAPRFFGAGDGDLAVLAGRAIAFIGYGNQGRAQALNLRDSGVAHITVGTLGDYSWKDAEEDGFAPATAAEAAKSGDIIFLLVPDEVLPEVFQGDLAPNLKPNDTLVFASGYNLTFAGVQPPADVDVVLLAPRMIGRQARQIYQRGEGFLSYVSVEQDASGRAWQTLLALAMGIGSLTAPGGGAMELSAREETLLDLLMEQGFGALLGATIYQTLAAGTAAGLPAEALVVELYLSGEMAETFQAMAELGMADQARLHSLTSQYGGMTRTMALNHEPLRKHIDMVIEEIRNGDFARRWAEERASGYENFTNARQLARGMNPFTPIEERLRAALSEAQEGQPGG